MRRTRGGPSRSSGRHHDWLGERRLCQGDAIDERRRKAGRLDVDFIIRSELPIARAEAEPARAEKVQMHVARPAVLRIFEVMVLKIAERVTHELLAAFQFAAVVDRAAAAANRTAQRDVLKIRGRVERRANGTSANFDGARCR